MYKFVTILFHADPAPSPMAALVLWTLCSISSPLVADPGSAPPPSERIRPDAALVLIGPDDEVIARILVEIADTPEARERGLMGRKLPDDDSGMLFVYPDAAPRLFWMRNTPGSLDILFADAQRRIFHIARETPAMSDLRHPSLGSAMYVLETRGGFAARRGVAPDTRFDYYPSPVIRGSRPPAPER